MKKSERYLIRQAIQDLIEELHASDSSDHQSQQKAELRLERLNSALLRLNAENFGECFKCEQALPFSLLLKNPEAMICENCLKG